jgi:hypothetical protein
MHIERAMNTREPQASFGLEGPLWAGCAGAGAGAGSCAGREVGGGAGSGCGAAGTGREVLGGGGRGWGVPLCVLERCPAEGRELAGGGGSGRGRGAAPGGVLSVRGWLCAGAACR